MTKAEVTQTVHKTVDSLLEDELPSGMEAAVKVLQSLTHDDDHARELLVLLYRDIADLSVFATIKALSGLGLLTQELSE